MEKDLFDLVQFAQNGDYNALNTIIKSFFPAIRSQCRNVNVDTQYDLEQIIVETIIKKVLTYDLSTIPDFTTFCRDISNITK
ncbi:helix-turn-helix domain-containing protein [Paenibacillus humicus]|uniref:helix-turn-helix domain-containing protein n=1 Tax=Paenibacillus humicus TaxID=412861 RepID=UPI003D2973FD